MAAEGSDSKLTPEKVRQILSNWFSERHTTTIVFREKIDPKNDPQDDYVVVYEAIFEPSSLDQAQVELWLTAEGYIAIGLERRGRIAERLGVRANASRFAAGHEPMYISELGLIAILDMIADGNIAISTNVIPLFGLISTKALMLIDHYNALVSKGYPTVNWLQQSSEFEFSRERSLLRYQRWS